MIAYTFMVCIFFFNDQKLIHQCTTGNCLCSFCLSYRTPANLRVLIIENIAQ